MTEDEKLSKAAGAMGRKRWANVPAAERSAQMRALQAKRRTARGGTAGGRPRKTKRCYCGMTAWKTAKIRGFRCCRKAGVEIPAKETRR